MKKGKKASVILIFSSLAVLILYIAATRSSGENHPLDDSKSAAHGDVAKPNVLRDSITQTSSGAMSLAAKAPNEVRLVTLSPIKSEDDFRALIENTDLFRSGSISLLVQQLRASDEKEIAQFFLNSLYEASDKDPSQRNRLLLIAESYQSDALLPYWKDLAMRTTPRTPDEKAMLNRAEPLEDTRGIHLEMMTAITHLGLIAIRDRSAADLLQDIILHPVPDVHSTFMRERAYLALKEADLTSAMITLKKLDKDDDLRRSLATK